MRTSRTNLFKITIFLFAALLITTIVSAQRNQGNKYPSLESQLTQKYHGHFVEQDTELAKL
nr:hypothetical protein [Pyrinomonadaceae bacterium]